MRTAQKLKTMMKKEKNAIADLKYRIQRYQRMGNGTACQELMMQLQKLQIAGVN